MRMLTAILCSLTVLLVSCGSTDHQVSGTSILTSDFDVTDSSGCVGTGNHRDINAGAPVEITDGGGTTLDLARLGEGLNVDDSCEFPFEAEVQDAESYSFMVAGRPETTLSRQTMESQDWVVSITFAE